MTCGNPIKHKIKNGFGNWFEMLSIERKLTDDQLECIQFGICYYSPRQVEEVPFFSFLVKIYLTNMFAQFLVKNEGDSFSTKRYLTPPHPIRRSTKPISEIIIFGIKMILSFQTIKAKILD